MSPQLTSLNTVMSSVSVSQFDLFNVPYHGFRLYQIMREAVVNAEKTFHGQVNAGKSKKECVMAALQAVADVLGENWDSIKEHFSVLVDAAISLWNAIHKKVTIETPSAGIATLECKTS
ncbi:MULTISPECIES: hypothetical protein [unclassified Pantoea]|uniref:hypothetical protein n=1 Tax=unclassified Pantoea TaxID=2630326 RepID=UPI001CD3D7EC|nr:MULTISPECIES: hypothetical protein [unclassified Pantoea]MCA1179802.1 hypothetical protein [Pantoea sp. alder69]MCA1253596.1 hypothetical protein [Pantoea sp. alder70]MCA1268288.1 hypothetical protein [Pantoea sp. alder81]